MCFETLLRTYILSLCMVFHVGGAGQARASRILGLSDALTLTYHPLLFIYFKFHQFQLRFSSLLYAVLQSPHLVLYI